MHIEVIVKTRAGGLLSIFKHREDLNKQGDAEHFEIKEGPLYECLNVLLKRISILRDNQRKSSPNNNYVISSSDSQTFSTY